MSAPLRERVEGMSDRALLLSVAALAAAARALYFATASGGSWADPVLDADSNLAMAHEMLRGPLADPYWQPPLYPWLLSRGLLLSPSLWPARLLSAALSCGTAALTASLAKAATGRRTLALLAGALVALHGPLLYYDGDLLPTSLGVFLATLTVWVCVRLDDDLWRATVAGACAGLAAAAVGPLGLLALPAMVHTARRGMRRGEYAATVLASMALVLSPVVRHNRLTGGGAVVALSGGINLWIGNNPAMNDLIAVRPGAGWEALADEPQRQGQASTPAAYDAYFARKAASFCARSPLRCAGNVADKARQLASSTEIPRNESLYVARARSPVLSALVWRLGHAGFPWLLLFPPAAAGLASLARGSPRGSAGDRPLLRWLALALLALAAGPLLFFVAGRYRMPMIPLLAVFAAAGADALLRRPADRRLWLAAAAALLLSLWPLHLPVERVNFEAETSYLIAGVRQRRGDLEGARSALEAALRARPDYPEAAVNLGVLHAQLGHPEQAERWLREALRLRPGDRRAQDALRSLRAAPP